MNEAVSMHEVAELAVVSNPWEPCSCCGGYGLRDYGGCIAECSVCGGGGTVRARDGQGRFTTGRELVVVLR